MLETLFETPWYVWAGLIGIGLVLFVWANRRLSRPYEMAGALIMLAGIVLGVAAYLVDTPREKVARGTRAFVRAVVDHDKKTLDGLLAPEAGAFNWDKQEIIDGAVHYATQEKLTSARIVGLNVAKEGDQIASYLTVWSQHNGRNALYDSLSSRWKFEWRKSNDQWLLCNIIPLQIGPIEGGEINSRYLSKPVAP